MVNVLKSLLISLTCVGSALACAVFWWPWGLLGSAPLAAISLWSMQKGWEDLSERNLENKALKVFRAMESPEITKDVLVRHYDVRPREADAVLAWLLRHELLQADWDEDDLDHPIVYRASELAIPAPPPGSRTATPPPISHEELEALSPMVPPPMGRSPFFGAPYGPKNPGVASLLSIFVPGLGHLYSGDRSRGIKVFFATYFGMAVFGFGVLIWFWQIGDAAETARKANMRWYAAQRRKLPKPRDDSEAE